MLVVRRTYPTSKLCCFSWSLPLQEISGSNSKHFYKMKLWRVNIIKTSESSSIPHSLSLLFLHIKSTIFILCIKQRNMIKKLFNLSSIPISLFIPVANLGFCKGWFQLHEVRKNSAEYTLFSPACAHG